MDDHVPAFSSGELETELRALLMRQTSALPPSYAPSFFLKFFSKGFTHSALEVYSMCMHAGVWPSKDHADFLSTM